MPRRKPYLDPKTTLTKRQMDNARAAIKTSKIVAKLQANLNGEIELTPGQIKSAEILLARTMPTLSAMEVTQDQLIPVTGPLETERLFEEMMKEHIESLPEQKKQELLGGNIIEVKATA